MHSAKLAMAHIKNDSVSLPTYFDFDKILRCRGLGSSSGYATNEMMGKRGSRHCSPLVKSTLTPLFHLHPNNSFRSGKHRKRRLAPRLSQAAQPFPSSLCGSNFKYLFHACIAVVAVRFLIVVFGESYCVQITQATHTFKRD